MGWLEPDGLLVRPLVQAMRHSIYEIVKETIQGDFESPQLVPLVQEKAQAVQEWVQAHVPLHSWTLGASSYSYSAAASSSPSPDWDVQAIVADFFVQIRLGELFEIVTEYPDSQLAVRDLQCLVQGQTGRLTRIGQHLRETLIRRLIHPGAETTQIIQVYMNVIQVLREMDPSDILLANVTEPIRTYLRGRHDTVRCIITSLTNTGDFLNEELRRPDAKPLETVTADSDDEEECPDLQWQPPPSIYHVGTFLERTSNDLLAMLVSIYGSKQLFVNEYRRMLADKLLQPPSLRHSSSAASLSSGGSDSNNKSNAMTDDTDPHVHTTELLKLRFGESSMRQCEVMLKDMHDSKRVTARIREQLPGTLVDASIVSHIFWPSLQGLATHSNTTTTASPESMKLHPRLQSPLDEYGQAFHQLKNPRQLIWVAQLGTVDLELQAIVDSGDDYEDENGDHPLVTETRQFSVSPYLATLIMYFEDKEEWSASDLSNETGVPEHVIQKTITYWISQRVLQLTSAGAYRLAVSSGSVRAPTVMASGGSGEHGIYHGSIDEHGGMATGSAFGGGEEEEMSIYESYIVGMLINMGQLSASRIHSMLKTFVTGSDVRYDKTPQQLVSFLQLLVKKEKLECGPDGMYKLYKK